MTSPLVAWTFDRHLDEVTTSGPAPGVALRAPVLLFEGESPRHELADAPGVRLLARTRHWTVEAACGAP